MATTPAPADPGTLDDRFSEPGAPPSTWGEAQQVLEASGTYLLTTVREDGRPHVTPLIAVWEAGALYFCTGPGEQKARNLAAEPRVVLAAAGTSLAEGLDVVVEGAAVRVTGRPLLERLAAAWTAKYGDAWRFDVREGGFAHPGGGGDADVYGVTPTTVFAFRKGGGFAQTRWRLR